MILIWLWKRLNKAGARPEVSGRLLRRFTVSDLVAHGAVKRSTLYRRISALRPVLTAYGLGPCWDGFQSA